MGNKLNDVNANREQIKSSFLLHLSDALRPLRNAQEIQSVASRLIAEYLDADRAYYATADSNYEVAIVEQEYLRGNVPSIIGRHKFSDFKSAFKAYITSQPLIINDVENDLNIPKADISAYLSLGIRAVVSIPLVKDKNAIASLNVLKRATYKWEPWEIEIIQDAAERTWEAVARANTEQALRASEEKYKNLFDAMDEGYCIIEMIYSPCEKAIDFRYLQVNRAFELNNGLFNAEGKTIREMVPTIEQKWIDIYDNVAQTGQSIRFEEDSIALNRNFSLYAFRIDEPAKRHVAVIFTDITLRKKSETALAHREKELTRVQEIGNIGGVNITVDNDLTSWRSEEYLRLHGLPPNTGIETHEDWLRRVHPDDKKYADDAIKNALSSNATSYQSEYRIIRPNDGAVRWIYAKLDIERDDSGKAIRLIGAHIDITERKNTELQLKDFNNKLEIEVAERTHELKLSKELLEKAFNAATISLVILKSIRNEGGDIVDFNHEWLNDTALKVIGKNMIGTNMLQKFPQLKALGLFDELVSVVDQNKTLDIDYHYKEEYYTIWVHLKAVRVDDGALVWMEDISSRKKTEFQLQEKQKELVDKNLQLEKTIQELESFNYVASHDLQEPLRKIQTLSKLIMKLDSDTLSVRSKDYFDHMNLAARQMQDLVNDLLTFSRTDSTIKHFQLTDMNLLLKEVVVEFSTLIDGSAAVVEFNSLPIIKVIPFQIKQVFANLISNSLKFGKQSESPKILIEYEKLDAASLSNNNKVGNSRFHHIKVIDNGIGFDPKFNEQIFGLFKRLQSKNEYPGTGIGLAIVKKIIDNHNGEIQAEGKEGVGTIIHIYLPDL